MFSPAVLIIAIVAILLLLVVLIMLAKSHEKPALASADSTLASIPKSAASVVVVTRVTEGLQKSLDQASALEPQLVAAVATEADSSSESTARVEGLDKDLRFVQGYIASHRNFSAAALTPDQTSAFLSDMREAVQSTDKGIWHFYDLMVVMLTASQAGSASIVNGNAKDQHLLAAIKSTDPYFKALLDALQESAVFAQRLHTGDSSLKQRQALLEEFDRGLLHIKDKLLSVAQQEARNKHLKPIPEWECLEKTLSEAVKAARAEQRVIAIRPHFEVTVLGDADRRELQTQSLSISFVISDRHEVKSIKSITVLPKCKSDNLFYQGEPRRNIEFLEHRAIVPFVFEAYIFDSGGADSRPEVAFQITFSLFGETHSEEVSCRLPQLIPRPQIRNPFGEGKLGTGLPGDSSLFVGRGALMETVARDLKQTRSEYYVFHGLPRTGKSSILNQFAENTKWLQGHYVPIRINAQASQQPRALFSNIYRILKDELLKRWPVSSPDTEPLLQKTPPYWRPITELLRTNEALFGGRKVLFLVDEWQELATRDQDAPGKEDVNTTWYQFPEFVKVLRDQYDRFATVMLFGLANLGDMERVNHNWITQLGGRVKEVQVTNLYPEEADELINKQLHQHGIAIAPAVLERIRHFTAAHAFLQMLMGYHIFELLIPSGSFRPLREVQLADIDEAASRISGSDLKFLWADEWIRNRPDMRLFLAALAKMSSKHAIEQNDLAAVGSYSLNEVRDDLFFRGDVEFAVEDFRTAMGELNAQGVVTRTSRGAEERYSLKYPLFALACDREQLFPRFLKEWRESLATRHHRV